MSIISKTRKRNKKVVHCIWKKNVCPEEELYIFIADALPRKNIYNILFYNRMLSVCERKGVKGGRERERANYRIPGKGTIYTEENTFRCNLRWG